MSDSRRMPSAPPTGDEDPITVKYLSAVIENAVSMERLGNSRGRPTAVPSMHPASLELSQGLAALGGTDSDTLTTKERYFLPGSKKLVVGKYVPDPNAVALKKGSVQDEQQALVPKPPEKETFALAKKKGQRNEVSREDDPEWEDLDNDDDDPAAPGSKRSRPVKNIVYTTYQLVKPHHATPLASGTLYFPIWYPAKLSLKEKRDPRGPARSINDAHTDTIRPTHGALRVQNDNLHKMCLYKIGPGAVAFKVVINAFEVAGMKYTPGDDWNIMWAKRCTPELLAKMTSYQHINHFLGAWGIGRKDNLHKNIRIMKTLHGAEYDIVPGTFVIPADRKDLEKDCAAWVKSEGVPDFVPTYICKPVASSCGKGIHLVRGLPENPAAANKSLLVQRYVGNPLLIEGRKFDLRVYVVATSFDPIRVYIFDEGLVRFAAEKYPGADSCLDNVQMHLTNYSVNKTAQLAKDSAGKTMEDDDPVEIKWLMSEFREYIVQTYAGKEKNEALGREKLAYVESQIEDIVIKAMLTVEIDIVNQARLHSRDGTARECFELYGFDLMLDERLRAYLIEVNIMPSLATGFSIDKAVKGRLLSHLLTMVGVVPHDRRRAKTENDDARVANDPEEQRDLHSRRVFSASNGKFSDVRYEYTKKTKGKGKELRGNLVNEPLLTSFDPIDGKPVVTAQELAVILEGEEELARSGGFRRVFPTANTAPRYFPLFRCGVLRSNYLAASWELVKSMLDESGTGQGSAMSAVKRVKSSSLRRTSTSATPPTSQE